MSALVQGGGYTVAATGPFVLGVVHEASGEWTAPLAVVIGSVLVLAVAGLLSSRERATRPG
jgi:MFS transporter, CP family, cyanate transporter